MSEQEAVAATTNTRRVRNRRHDSDDDENDSGATPAVAVPQTAGVKPASPTAPRAKAPSAAKAPAAAPTMPHKVHADPQQDAAAGAAADAATAAAKSAAATSPEALFEADYDTITLNDLQLLMKRFSRAVVEEHMAQREQQQQTTQQQQQSQRVERFLDVPAAVASSSDNAEHRFGFTYNEMLSRLFEALNRNNEGSAMAERNQLPVPVLEKIGKKKTVISNFGRICQAFHRPMEDVKDFIEKELSIRGNLDSNNALILKFEIRKATDFDRVLIKYLDEFVKCNSCHRIDTTLTKDGRRMELRCNWCTATRTVTAVGTATFSAQIEKRSRQRAAMTL